MLIYPHINTLLEKVDSRYTLVTLTAKRARQLVEGANVLTQNKSGKPVTIAINEIQQNMVGYVRNTDGLK